MVRPNKRADAQVHRAAIFTDGAVTLRIEGDRP